MKTNKDWFLIIAYIIIDLICAAMGMGVPFFNILLGFPLGLFLALKLTTDKARSFEILQRIFTYSLLASSFTFLIMAVIWLPTIKLLFGPMKDIINFGEPQILYDPIASFIGWIILMVFISPFLQLLTTIFSAYLVILTQKKYLKNK